MRSIYFLLILVVLAGCNQVRSGFRPTFTQEALAGATTLERFEGEPTIRDGVDIQKESDDLRREGWVSVGYTVFAEDFTAEQQLRSLAKEYKAELITRYRVDQRGSSSIVPITTGSGTIFVPSYSSTTTLGAVLWMRNKRIYLSVYGRNLTEQEAAKRNDANGAYIGLIVRGGAAERGGLKEVDIVSSVGGKDIISYADMLRTYHGMHITSIDFRVTRDGQTQTIAIPKDPPTE